MVGAGNSSGGGSATAVATEPGSAPLPLVGSAAGVLAAFGLPFFAGLGIGQCQLNFKSLQQARSSQGSFPDLTSDWTVKDSISSNWNGCQMGACCNNLCCLSKRQGKSLQ